MELVAAGDGTDLVLDHRGLPLAQYAGLGAGWDAYLAGLARARRRRPAPDWDERFLALLPAYRERVAALG